MKELEIDYDILETFLCEEEKQYFIEWDKEWNKNIGCGYNTTTNCIVTYYKTRTGHISVNIPYDDYKSLYLKKQRDIKLTSLGL